ncbi:MAG: hydroxyethylthiazole kinase [Ignavibacteriales bacterium]
MTAGEICGRLLEDVRVSRPLVHHITNWVVTNVSANVTLAAGASPVMAHAIEEVADMVKCAGALVLNTGTLTPDLVEAMIVAGRQANSLGVPVILDPVGVGATPLRTKSVGRILGEVRVGVLRGNAAEIGIVSGAGGDIRGVDSRADANDPVELARAAARRFRCVAAITGKTDFVSDGETVVMVDNGHEMLTRVTGTGCMATSVIGAFAAVTKDLLWAAAGALACYGVAAEIAAAASSGPGTFQAALLDAMYNLTPSTVKEKARVRAVWPAS